MAKPITRGSAWVVMLVSLAGACDSATEPTGFFGADYSVELDPAPPVLGTTLSITVAYGACGSQREFQLRHRMLTATEAEVWLRKVAPDESCDMLVTERREFAIPAPVGAATSVTLLMPPESEPYRLRP
jgi:hypothetical protein